MAIRWIAGPAMINRHEQSIHGINILLLLVFVSAVMALPETSWPPPWKVMGLTLLAFALFFVMFWAGGFSFFRPIGPDHALSLDLVVTQRNMGRLLAATEGALPAVTWLYFAMCQLSS